MASRDAAARVEMALTVIHRRDLRQLRRLLERGLNVNSALPEGLNLLMAASHEGWTEAVQLLLALGADVSVRDSRGFTALGWAAQALHTDVVDVLLKAGADPSVRDANGRTAFQRTQDTLRTRLLFGRALGLRLPRWIAHHPVLDLLANAKPR